MSVDCKLFVSLSVVYVLLTTCLVIFAAIVSKDNGYREGYKEACVDFYKGKQLKMSLHENADGSKEWVWISK